MVTFVERDGQRVTPWMAYCIDRLSADMHSLFGVWVRVRSAIRTYEDQKRIFLERYVTAGDVRGRRVYDTRWWNGRLWYRISSAGTVAVPGTSNHEIQGSKAAVDLYDTGSDGGIATMGSARSNWLRANAWKYGLVASGFGFGEAWHYDVLNIFNAVPGKPAGGGTSTPANPKRKKRNMSTGVIHTDDKSDSKRSGAIVDFEAGTFSPFGWFSVAYANGVAKGFGLEASGPVTRGHYDAIKATVAARAAAMGKVFVDIADEDVPQIKS